MSNSCLSGNRANSFEYPQANLRPVVIREANESGRHGEVSRAKMQHYSEVCHCLAIGSKELTGVFSGKTQQNQSNVALSVTCITNAPQLANPEIESRISKVHNVKVQPTISARCSLPTSAARGSSPGYPPAALWGEHGPTGMPRPRASQD